MLSFTTHHSSFLRPEAQSESIQINVLALLAVVGAAAVDGEAEVGPQAGGFAGVVVAVVVGVTLQQPAPAAPLLAAHVGGLLLPALEDPAQGGEGQLPGALVGDL